MSEPVAAVGTAGRVRQVVREVVVRSVPGEPVVAVTESTPILDLGLSSVRLVELTFVLEQLFGLAPDALDAGPVPDTLAELEHRFVELVSAGEARVPDEEAVAVALRAWR